MTKAQFVRILCAVAVLIMFCLNACGTGNASNGKQTDAAAMHTSDKIEPSLRIELEQLKEKGQLDTDISVVIRIGAGLDESKRMALEKSGVRIGSELKDILTGKVAARSIPGIADLEFVISIEKSKRQKVR